MMSMAMTWWLVVTAPVMWLEAYGAHVDRRVSPAFTWTVWASCQSLPPALLSQLQKRGWRIELVPSLADALPWLADAAPRGWPDGWTWKNVDAVHLPSERRILFAEWRVARDGRWVRCHRVAGVVRHELAHAWDAACRQTGSFSESSRFRLAYQREVARLPASVLRRLGYFVQPTDAGRQEAFAELAALVWGGGSSPHLATLLRQSFPQTMAVVRSSWVGAAVPVDVGDVAASVVR